ncbi:hypothetical protein RMATCC62417_06805 [Rhizopus microsporus]|nr:hypothetical protein RMATCC62417_06805 [Rhizopus microsporus]
MRTVTIKQQQQMTKEIEEQLGNGRLNYLKVVNDYCYWMGWKKQSDAFCDEVFTSFYSVHRHTQRKHHKVLQSRSKAHQISNSVAYSDINVKKYDMAEAVHGCPSCDKS